MKNENYLVKSVASYSDIYEEVIVTLEMEFNDKIIKISTHMEIYTINDSIKEKVAAAVGKLNYKYEFDESLKTTDFSDFHEPTVSE